MKRIKVCSVEGCDGVAYTRSWCMKHYWRWHRHGTHDSLPRGPKPTQTHCNVEGCLRSHSSKGYCNLHYKRWKQHGDPLTVKRAGRTPNDNPTPHDNCAFVITRAENERFHATVAARIERWLAPMEREAARYQYDLMMDDVRQQDEALVA